MPAWRPKADIRFSRIFFKSITFFTTRLGSNIYSTQLPLLRNRGAVLEIAEVSHKLSNECYGAEAKENEDCPEDGAHNDTVKKK